MRHAQPLPATVAVPLLAVSAAIIGGVIAALEWLR
jgi:hypothetical protein